MRDLAHRYYTAAVLPFDEAGRIEEDAYRRLIRRVAGFALAVSLATGIVFGLLPALTAPLAGAGTVALQLTASGIAANTVQIVIQ